MTNPDTSPAAVEALARILRAWGDDGMGMELGDRNVCNDTAATLRALSAELEPLRAEHEAGAKVAHYFNTDNDWRNWHSKRAAVETFYRERGDE